MSALRLGPKLALLEWMLLLTVQLELAAGSVEVRVLAADTHQPLREAGITLTTTAGAVTNLTDASGRARIELPASGAGAWRLGARHSGFAPMTMTWAADKVPPESEFLLTESEPLGGRVNDERGAPIGGAKVALVVPERLAGPWVDPAELSAITGTDGRWECKAVPKDSAYVLVELSHADFAADPQEAAAEALRAGTAEMKMWAVATVRGRVLAEAGRGIAGAELLLGGEREIWPGSRTLETRSDAEGRFEFPRLRLEARLLGVHAPGFAPLLQRIEIKRDLPVVELRPGRGQPLRVRVVDDSGQSITRARAQVDEWPSGLHVGSSQTKGRWAYPGWEWETDSEGRFVWTNAPGELGRWSFSRAGYMRLGAHGLKPTSEEQVIKLGLPFRVSGSVTDATTGQPVPDFVVVPRFVRTSSWPGGVRTNSGQWYEHNRKHFARGTYNLLYESPLLHGAGDMHDWQFRVEADDYAPSLSRVVRDAERGLRLDFVLSPQPLPHMTVPVPTGVKRVTASAAVQPAKVAVGETVTVFVKLRIAPGHHLYALENSGCANLPTTPEATLAGALDPDGPWRSPEPKVLADGSRTLAGDVLLRRRFRVRDYAPVSSYALPVTIRFQVCNEALCWPPEKTSLETGLEVVRSEQ